MNRQWGVHTIIHRLQTSITIIHLLTSSITSPFCEVKEGKCFTGFSSKQSLVKTLQFWAKVVNFTFLMPCSFFVWSEVGFYLHMSGCILLNTVCLLGFISSSRDSSGTHSSSHVVRWDRRCRERQQCCRNICGRFDVDIWADSYGCILVAI